MKSERHWKPIGFRPHHGILVPLFAIRTQTSRSMGGFLDLIPLIDWCKKIHFDTLQLLPLNDTGEDPSPYNPISSCALDPVYLSIPYLEEGLSRSEVKKRKLDYFRDEYQKNPIDTRSFIKENPWIYEYGRFSSDIEFAAFVQYHCFSQMRQVKEHATKQGVFLIGDLPHLISSESADIHSHPELFRQDLVAGAPPDKYNSLGQKWGFPLYNWEAMRTQKFAWWKERFKTIESFYHIYRIDHVVGFFRIWAIPKEKEATAGFFLPKEESRWMGLGREILEMMIDASKLLPIAEDLGVIPKGVFPILKELGICGTKVLRWEGDTPYNSYEPFSLTTVSTPDMEPLQLFMPTLTVEGRREVLKGAHSTDSYFHVNLLQEYLRLFSELSWPNPEADRINVPGAASERNWSYHFRPFLEEITAHGPLAEAMRSFTSH